MSMDFQPLYDRILARRLEGPSEMRGGLIIPDTAKEKPLEAEVVSVGEGKLDGETQVPLTVKAGDRVLIGKFAGNEVSIDDTEYVILKEDEILGILED